MRIRTMPLSRAEASKRITFARLMFMNRAICSWVMSST